MERKDVYGLIDGEREYQDKLWDGKVHDAEHSVANWTIFMREHIERAMSAGIYELDTDEALNHVRKIAALAVACMEHHDTKPRQMLDPKIQSVIDKGSDHGN